MKKLLQAKTFIIPAMRAGLCEYDEERVKLTNATLEAMAKTSFGIPLILPEHVEIEELEKNLEQYLCGRVADMHFDESKDLWMAHCVADTEEAVKLFEKGWGVSTSYRVDEKGKGGTLNGVAYDSEVTAATYLHLAIVEKPRYEMAKDPVFYNSAPTATPAPLTTEPVPSNIESSISKKGEVMLKFFKVKREEIKENAADTMVEIDGKEVSMNELVEAYKASKAGPAKENEEPGQEPGKDEPKPEGEKPQENAEGDEEKLNAEVEALLASLTDEDDEPKDNEDEPKEDEPKDNEEGKDEKKTERFNSMKKASQKTEVLDNGLAGYKTIEELALIGKQRYGSK